MWDIFSIERKLMILFEIDQTMTIAMLHTNHSESTLEESFSTLEMKRKTKVRQQ